MNIDDIRNRNESLLLLTQSLRGSKDEEGSRHRASASLVLLKELGSRLGLEALESKPVHEKWTDPWKREGG